MRPSRGGESSEAPVPPSSLPSKVVSTCWTWQGVRHDGAVASDEQQRGLVFPTDEEGRRSTSTVGRLVVADALRETDPTGAGAAERATGWRTDYLVHFRRLVEAGLESREAAVSIAGNGLDSLHERMKVVDEDGQEHALGEWDTVVRRARPPGVVTSRASRCSDVGSRSTSWCCPTGVTGCAATTSAVASTPGSTRAWSSRPSRSRSTRCSPTRTGSGWRGTPWPSWEPAPRWDRSRR